MTCKCQSILVPIKYPSSPCWPFYVPLHHFCLLTIFESTWRILAKVGRKVKGDDPQTPVDFRNNRPTLAPPVGHFCVFYVNFCPAIFSETAWRILSKVDTKVQGDDPQTPVDFSTIPSCIAPPVCHFVFRLSYTCPNYIFCLFVDYLRNRLTDFREILHWCSWWGGTDSTSFSGYSGQIYSPQ